MIFAVKRLARLSLLKLSSYKFRAESALTRASQMFFILGYGVGLAQHTCGS